MNVEPGEIVQLDPENTKNPMLAGCFMVVTETRSWGVIGYIQCTGVNMQPGGLAYYRAVWDEIATTGGHAEWITE